jgi:PTS system mannose-specific IIB component
MPQAVHIRVDNRLLHGQVVQFWIPHLEIDNLVIADDGVAANQAMLAVYRMALPERVGLEVVGIVGLAAALDRRAGRTTLALISDIHDALRARISGVGIDRLTLGNVHSLPSRTRVTDSVFLSVEEQAALGALLRDGVAVEIQTFPGETIHLELNAGGEARWAKG